MTQDLGYVTERIEQLRREAAANRLAGRADTLRRDERGHVSSGLLAARRGPAALRIGAVMLAAAVASVAAGPVLAERSAGGAGRPNRPSPPPTTIPSATPTATAVPTPVAPPSASPTPSAAATPSPNPTISPEPSPSSSGNPVAYTNSYWAQLALFPQGWANNYCVVAVTLSGGVGFCEDVIDPVYLFPNGTWGSCPWKADPALELGWSIDEERCPGDFEGF